MLKVTAYSVGGKGNKVYMSGAIVSENSFDNAEELVKKGFLAPLESKSETSAKQATGPLLFEDITVKQLKAILVEFPENAKKPELYDLYLSTFE
jgi:hypothetical protein